MIETIFSLDGEEMPGMPGDGGSEGGNEGGNEETPSEEPTNLLNDGEGEENGAETE